VNSVTLKPDDNGLDVDRKPSLFPMLVIGAASLATLAWVLTTTTDVAELFRPKPANEIVASRESIAGWPSFGSIGHLMGPARAPVVVVEFSDFQCPACAMMTKRLHALRKQYPRRLSIRYRHYPLFKIHAYATEASIAAECASDQGRFESMHDVLFGRQDSLGVKSWASYAKNAGVRDTVEFNTWRKGGRALRAINSDRAAGDSLHLTGTPSLIINGTLFRTPPTDTELERLVAVAKE
jgi:protein-disulfide isomerase